MQTLGGLGPDDERDMRAQDAVTLRDYFAAKALEGWLAGNAGSGRGHPAESGMASNAAWQAYALADAMLEHGASGDAVDRLRSRVFDVVEVVAIRPDCALDFVTRAGGQREREEQEQCLTHRTSST